VLQLVELAARAGLPSNIVEVEPVVALPLEVDARREADARGSRVARTADRQSESVVESVEIDMANVVGFLRLRLMPKTVKDASPPPTTRAAP